MQIQKLLINSCTRLRLSSRKLAAANELVWFGGGARRWTELICCLRNLSNRFF